MEPYNTGSVALVDEDNNVVNIIVINNFIDGQSSVFGGAKGYWTHEQGEFRKNYAMIGGVYDPDRDAFIDPKPEGDFTLDEETCRWVPVVENSELGA